MFPMPLVIYANMNGLDDLVFFVLLLVIYAILEGNKGKMWNVIKEIINSLVP